MRKKDCVCTIVSKNYLSYARVFVDSLISHNKDINVHVLLVDRVDGYFDPEKENFILTKIEEIEINDLPSFCFKYNVTELNTAAKPFFINHLFKNYGYEKVIYFDPDILVMNSLDDLFKLLDKYSVVLIPHITSPIDDDGKHINEIDLLMSGAYNLGFLGLSNYKQVRDFLHWWEGRLYKYCFSAPSHGLFVDQKWIDLLPGMIEDVHILRHPGYNVAYWNLHERKISYENGRFSVNGSPLYFFHFSGFIFNNLECISKYQDRFSLNNFPHLSLLFEKYRDLLVQKDYLNTKDWPYSFGKFDNGVPLHDLIRQLYNGLKSNGIDFGNPFSTGHNNSFFNWLNKPVKPGSPVTNLLDYIYYLRPDLQKAFPDHLNSDLAGLVNWARHAFKAEYGFDERLMPFLDYKFKQKPALTEIAKSKYSLVGFKVVKKIKELVWKYGLKYAKIIKSIPLLNIIAFRVYTRLASERTSIDLLRTIDSYSKETNNRLRIGEDNMGINIAGYIDTESGVAEAARGIIRSIKYVNMPYALNNIKQEFYRRNDKTFADFSDKNPYPINLIHVNADQVPHVFQVLGENYFKDRYNIGYWFWELSEFPEEWIPSFSYFNEIWVGSDFCLDSISRVSPVPVVKIPPSVILEDKFSADRDYFGIEPDRFIFLTMFDFLSFIERKNPMAVIEAFRMAFHPGENVTLIVKCTNSSYNEPMLEQLTELGRGLNVKIIDKYLDKHELNSLINVCDCYISLHRSEGFGLPMAEAMLLGKPVIATAYSGNIEFMNINNSFPVKYSLIEIKENHGPYKKGNVWADPDISHAAELMRYVFQHTDIAAKIAQNGMETIKRLFNPAIIGSKIKERVCHIANKI